MSKIKPVVEMKRRLQEALRQLEEQEAVIDLVKEMVERYGLTAKDLFPRINWKRQPE